MILNSQQIKKAMRYSEILVEPFNTDQLNPNSYDVTLDSKLKFYTNEVLDPRKDHNCSTLIFDEYVLRPGRIWLASTVEWTSTQGPYVPMLEGKSTLARLGLSVHCSAGFGDRGFRGNWTLELSVRQPVKIYAGMRIAQLYWITTGHKGRYYSGRYQDQIGPTQARLEE